MRSNSWVVQMLLLLSLSALTAACGGGGAGGVSSTGGISGGGGVNGAGAAGGGSAPLATGIFTKTAHKMSVASASLDRHFSALVPSIRVQHLYSGTSGATGNRIQGSGYVTAVAFRSNSITTGLTCPDVTIKMGHTSVTSLTTTFANNVEQGKGSLVTVLQNKQIAVPSVGVGDYIKLALDTPFYFNGVDNLVVEYIRNGACSKTISLQFDYTMPPDQALDTVTPADTTGSLKQPPNMQFLFSGGDDTVEYGGANSSNLPFGRLRRTQMLYLASEINGTGPITGIALQANATTTTGSYTYTLRLGHTTLSALTASFAANYNAGTPSTIVSSGIFTIPAGIPAGEYIWIPFPGTFTYNGQDNLIVDIDVSRGAVLNVMRYTEAVGAGRMLGGATGSNVANIWTGTSLLNMKFRFSGGPVSVVNTGTTSDDRFFSAGAADGVASLFRATELGTGGTITSIACRAAADTIAGSYPSFKLIVGHTTANTLTGPADLVSQTTVYSAAFNIFNTILKGDWIEIPLSTTFAYDGTSNLIVWMGTTAADGTGTNRCSFSNTDAARYQGHVALGVPGGTSFSGQADLKTDIKMKILKY